MIVYMYRKYLILLVVVGAMFPGIIFAQTSERFEVSGWIPYWRAEKGVNDILPRLDLFTEVNPFIYTVKTDGTLNQAELVTNPEWLLLQKTAKETGVLYIPTVMWANSDAIHDVLSDPEKRQSHIQSIALNVYRYGFDGVDIDYEAKYAKTRESFSIFLKELKEAIGFDKKIQCTIESRTPLDSRYSSIDMIPENIEYSNDFSEINKYCDRVRIMAYDQGRYDLKLNDEKDHPYIPVADKDWVRKVMELVSQDIDKSKLLIGVPTYGYEYDIFESSVGNGDWQYSRLWSFNPGYAKEIADKLGLAYTPTRNSAGELFFSYPAKDAPDGVIPLPNATRVMSWSDAESIRDKAKIAEELGLRGISIFKIDGGEDPLLWDVLTEYKNKKVSVVENVVGSNTSITPVVASENTSSTSIDKSLVPTRDLYTGVSGADVKNLQKILNQIGFTVAVSGPGSPGNETEKFGALTRSALARFQSAHNIKPAIGYFGPITRKNILAI